MVLVLMFISIIFLNAPVFSIDQSQQYLVNHVVNSIRNAEKGYSKLNNEILKMKGLTGYKIKHLLNNLCSLKNGRYLEIGVWRGSTFVAALYGNHNNLSDSIAIDNWSKSNSPKKIFFDNVKKYLTRNRFKFYEANSFKLNLSEMFKQSINIYFYDGDHTAISQERAFTYFNSILSDTFIAVIDDYNRDIVKLGTKNAFKKLNYKILFEKYLFGKGNNDYKNYWNGIYIAVISKK